MWFDGTRLEASPVETYPRRRDDLPYDIDFSGAVDVPPPGPGGRPTPSDQAAWAVRYARNHARRLVVVTRDGWLVGFHGGEWGGSLWWYPASPGPGLRLSDRNVRAIIARSDGRSFRVLVGRSYPGTSRGAVLTIDDGEGTGWHVSGVLELLGAPYAHAPTGGGLLIATDSSVERLSASGELDVLSDAEYGAMTPVSVAMSADGRIAVGLRFFVHVLVPGGSQYWHEWFVPPKCTRFVDRLWGWGCECTGPG